MNDRVFNPLADGAPLSEILAQVREFLRRFVAFPTEAHCIVIALWIAHTWAIEAFDFAPYLHISSPVKRCGKSRLLDCLKILVAKPWEVVSPSPAVLYRKIEMQCPTLLLDEVDTIFSGKGDDSKEALRAILNAGFERGAKVPRCVGAQHTLIEFEVFCPKALAGIGKLPDTIGDRCIPIILARRAPTQRVERFRARDAQSIAQPLADALSLWSKVPETILALRAARPVIPEELGDRQADICEPLLAIAELAGSRWPELTRRALVELCTGEDVQTDSIGVQLLAAFRDIFREHQSDRISTHAALDALIARDNDEPWATMWERDITSGNVRGPAAKLARLLKPFKITAGSIRESDGSTPKGYKLESFVDVFSRYLSDDGRENATTPQPA